MTDELFFDTDCLSAFLWINNTNILQTLYSGRIVLPEPVYQELSNPSIPHIKQRADKLISTNVASVQQMVTASNNYKDIALYIKRYHLKHVDTGHILMEAMEKQIITELEGNTIWQNMSNKNRRLPETSFSEYLRKNHLSKK